MHNEKVILVFAFLIGLPLYASDGFSPDEAIAIGWLTHNNRFGINPYSQKTTKKTTKKATKQKRPRKRIFCGNPYQLMLNLARKADGQPLSSLEKKKALEGCDKYLFPISSVKRTYQCKQCNSCMKYKEVAADHFLRFHSDVVGYVARPGIQKTNPDTLYKTFMSARNTTGRRVNQ